MIEINEKAEDFTLDGIDEEGNEKEFSLSDFEGKNVVLFFYPMDNTPGCTIEASDFSNIFHPLNKDVVVIGISRDDIDSHKKFQDNYDLEFILLSDPESKVHEEYGVIEATDLEHKKMIRSTFLIDKSGIVRNIWKEVDVNGHAEEVMKALKELA